MDYPYITSILWSHLKVPLASQVVSHLSSAASRFVALELHGSVVRVAKPRGGNRGGQWPRVAGSEKTRGVYLKIGDRLILMT
jgi:hypothetical protein